MTVRVQARSAGLSIPLALATAAAVVAPAIAWLGIDRMSIGFCMFKRLSGLPCMTCGTTRALGRLGRLDLLGALHVNPLATTVILGLVLFGLAEALLRLRGESLSVALSPTETRALFVIVVALVMLNWAYLIAARV